MILIALAAAVAAQSPAACPNVVTPDAFVCRALAADKARNPQEAALAFEQAAKAASETDPATSRMWAAAGNMWIAAGQPGKAALALDRALAGTGLQAEQRGEALLDRARAAESQNDRKTARAKVTEAAQTISDDPFLWYFSAALAIRENDAATAKSSIGRALTLAPNEPTVLFEAGHVAHFSGDEKGARDYWARAAAADPSGATGKAATEVMKMLDTPPAAATKAQPSS